jgi:hypothetical protein
VKQEIVPIAKVEEPCENSSSSDVETWKRFRESADAGVRAIKLAFVKNTREFKGSKDSPVVESISSEYFESTLRASEFFGFRFGRPNTFTFSHPEKVRRRIFLCRPKLPYSND